MNRILMFYSLIYSVALLFSCKNNEPFIPLDPEKSAAVYEQYGTPMINVPETGDIVMYEVNLRAFSAGGNLQGVINRLDFIQDLGVNVIWLMPIHPIGQVNSVNSPYSVQDYKAVGSEYGTLEDLRALTDEAHSRGIAVIMDWVANHTAWDNNWIINKNWYTQDINGNIIHPPGTNWMDVADLNYSNMDMRAEMIDAMSYWAYEANIDGFRCDYADGVPYDFWTQAWDSIKSIPNRKFILLAEGSRDNHLDAGFDLNFSWEFYGAMKNVFNGQSVNKLFAVNENEYTGIPNGKHWLRFTTNHDESAWDATPITLFNGTDGALAASVATIFTGGVPLIYAGQEVGIENNIPFFSNTVTNWNSNPEMRMAYEGILQFYTNSEIAKNGVNTTYNHSDILCFKKTFDVEDILIIVNLRNLPVDFVLPTDLQNTTWTSAITSEVVSFEDLLSLDPYSYYILK